MALTILEQIKVKRGDVKPSESSLLEVVANVALRHANWFYNNHKETDPKTAAANYQRKKYNIANRVINNDSNVFRSLLHTVVMLAGNIINYTDLESYTDDNWETLVENNILDAFDLVGNITLPEKTHYNSL